MKIFKKKKEAPKPEVLVAQKQKPAQPKKKEMTNPEDMKELGNMSIEAQIYRDVYSAQDILLQEARRILEQPFDEKLSEEMEKLSKIGFKNAEQVAEYTRLKQERDHKVLVEKVVQHYAQRYPLQRFITRDVVDAVCKKYALYLAKPEFYTAEIPEKNRKDILNFKVHCEDVYGWCDCYDMMDEKIERSAMFGTVLSRGMVLKPGVTKQMVEEEKKNRLKRADNGEKMEATGVMIMAPEHKLDMSKLTVIGNEAVDKQHVINEDPIVLQPVNKGYLIITSWGLEASDENIVHSITN